MPYLTVADTFHLLSTPKVIGVRIDACFDDIVTQVGHNREQFVWEKFASVEELARVRRAAMLHFLNDYRRGDPRYLDAALPELPFDMIRSLETRSLSAIRTRILLSFERCDHGVACS